MNDANSDAAPLPLVIQLGFAGSRRLLDSTLHPGIDAAAFEAEIEKWLTERLGQLRTNLRLEKRHFFCGISAIAAGGDTLFSKACRACGISQRILLPQTRDEFLNAGGSTGPDFTPHQKEQALSLLDSPHVIQERLVSDASQRNERFEDVNREIVRVTDVLICLLRHESHGKPGGTEDLIARAIQRGKPVLVIRVAPANGKPVFTEEWRLPDKNGKKQTNPAESFDLPRPPVTLTGVQFNDAGDDKTTLIERYVTRVKEVSSATAKKMQDKFKLMAMTIICTHIIATILAAIALGFAGFHLSIIPVLLSLELVMLIIGFWVHHRLEHTLTARKWAEARLLAEVARSVLAVGSLHVYLEHLFSLPFPPRIRPLLRTISVLQLQCTRQDRTAWQPKRDHYVQQRLKMPDNGQVDFYDRRTNQAKTRLQYLHTGFIVFWSMAFIATLLKLTIHHYMKDDTPQAALLIGIMGTLAIVMPVLAAGALSLSAALDLEAQEQIYKEMLGFLEQQNRDLNTATSARDYARLVIETESRLLGETANWFARRSFTGVA